MIRLNSFAGQSIAVFGLGGSGRVAARALLSGGANVSAWDDTASARDRAAGEGIPVHDLKAADWGSFDALVLAPGVPLTHPEPHWSVVLAREAGCPIIGDIELFCRQRATDCPDAPFIAITGTNGKSTTTALVSHLLARAGLDVQMGGNIGTAILELEPPSMSRVHVIEVSSYQIDLAPSLNPTVGVLLNVSADHLDRHGTIEHYASVKERLVAGAEAAVVGLDDSWTRDAAARLSDRARLYPFTIGKGAGLVPRLYAIGSSLFLHESDGAVSSSDEVASLDGVQTLRGIHNVQNALGALGAIKALQDWLESPPEVDGGRSRAVCDLGTVWDAAQLQAGLSSFPGLAHRLEAVGEAGGVAFVNDSKATNVTSVMTALKAWNGGVYWIAGGLAKDGGIEDLAPFFDRIEKAYLIGDASDDFAKTLDGHVAFERCGTLEVAVSKAAADAAAQVGGSLSDGPVVLLSPACASFDQFLNFEARGDAFRDLVANVPGVTMRGRAT